MTNSTQPAAASLPALDTDYLATLTPDELSALADQHDGLWPYSEHAGLLDRKTALQVRLVMLCYMSEAELNSCSVRELIALYVEYLGSILEDYRPEMASPEVQAGSIERVAYVLGMDPERAKVILEGAR